MTSPKIVVYGNPDFFPKQLNVLSYLPIEITSIPATVPVDRLESQAPFSLVLLNFNSESEDTLKQIKTLRQRYRYVPLILAASNPSVPFLVQAYRCGLTDCLLGPFKEEQLGYLVSTYLKKQHQLFAAAPINAFSASVVQQRLVGSKNGQEADLSVSFLGTFRLFRRGEQLDLPGGARQRSLLAFMFYHAHTQVHRDKIIQWFWPNHDPDGARNNLNVAICHLRKYLEQFAGQDVICFHNGYFFLNQDLVIHRDTDQFIQYYQQGREAESRGMPLEAANWYQLAAQSGVEFLEEFAQEDWTVHPREEFTEKLFYALDQLSSHQQESKCYEAALITLRHMLYVDDCLESVHAKVISCYLALGKNDKAVRQFHECERILLEKLKMRPSLKTTELYQQARGQALVA